MGEGEEAGRRTPGRFLVNHLKHKLGAGLLVVIPLGITIFILRFLFNLADGVLAPYIKALAGFFFDGGRYIPGLGMIAGLIVIYFTGLLATNVLGRQIVNYGDRLLTRIPLVKSIYSTSRQLTDVFARKDRSAFRRAVYVEFPLDGTFALAFVTGEVVTASGKRYCNCFVPTAPNPTSGFILLLAEEQIDPAEMSVEEAMKVIVSGGFVAPEVVRSARLR